MLYVLLAAPLSAETAPFTLVPAVPFADPDGIVLAADLYVPKGSGPFAGIVFLHGGGWNSGDRTQLHRQAEYMAERGMMGMAIEYRLTPANPYPAALEDAKQAVMWLRDHAAAYHVDPARIGAVGSSAGGHLAAMLGVESASDKKGAVQAVVVLNGIFDLASMPPGTMVAQFLGKSCMEALALCAEASPIGHVAAGAPPFLVMHGTADMTAPYAQAKAFVERSIAAGGKVEFYTVDGAPHTFWSKPQWKDSADEKMAGFLKQQLAPQ